MNNGYKVAVFSSKGSEILKLQKKEKFILFEIYFVREINLIKDFYALISTVISLYKFRPDIVNSGTPKAGILLMIASFIIRTPIRIFTFRGLRSETLTGSKKHIVRFMEKASCLLSTHVIAISPSLKLQLENESIVKKGKCIVLAKGSSNGVDINRFSLNNPDLNFDNKIKSVSNEYVIGYVGRLVLDKGLMELYQAFLRLKSYCQIKLVIIGGYEYQNKLPVDFINNLEHDKNVEMLGEIIDVENYYPSFDVLVLPSHREGFGNVILEAAAMNIPSIASNIPGIQDAVEDHVTGLLFKVHSESDLYLKLKYYFDNPEIRKKHGIDAQYRAKKYFSNKNIWNEQLEFYRKCTDKTN